MLYMNKIIEFIKDNENLQNLYFVFSNEITDHKKFNYDYWLNRFKNNDNLLFELNNLIDIINYRMELFI